MRKYLLLCFLFILLSFYALAPIFSEGEVGSSNESGLNIITVKSGDKKIFRDWNKNDTEILDFTPPTSTPPPDLFDSLGIWREWYQGK